MNHITSIAAQLKVRPQQVSAAVDLLDDDNTLPFIARYRKEATGGLDELQLRQIEISLARWRALDERRKTVLKSIDEQGKLTPDLEKLILAVDNMTALEDLYQAYKPKRRTRASIARESGLKPLANLIIEQPETGSIEIADKYLSEHVLTIEDAWKGARDIVSELISDDPRVRSNLRRRALKTSILRCEQSNQAEDPKKIYQLYYDFSNRVDRLRPHQVLAINRGEDEKILRVVIEIPERDWKDTVYSIFHINPKSYLAEQLELARLDAVDRLLLPAIIRDIRRSLKEDAQKHAIKVFADNLHALLMLPPITGKTVLGIDPGYRTGCKLAVTDPTGKVVDTGTIYPHPPRGEWKLSKDIVTNLVEKHGISLIVIGNGTASRETEQFVAELTRSAEHLKYLIVNEAGASVYSASLLASQELPDMDVSLRGAVSIARRVQDPLAELVKIEPRSIGIGMYQHDVDQKLLADALQGVVENVVNRVGVELNTASISLLAYVSGVGSKLSEKIVEHRNTQGPFANRESLIDVSGMGPKSYQQCAGFLRIVDSRNPLDASAIHPESYQIAEELLALVHIKSSTPIPDRKPAIELLLNDMPIDLLATKLNTGVPTLSDIIDQLMQPGRDPRQDLPSPILRDDVLSMDDLVVGMRLMGTVRNVVDFGAFIDIGVKQDGLLHRSKIPFGVELQVGYVLEVEILGLEPERGRISLGYVGEI